MSTTFIIKNWPKLSELDRTNISGDKIPRMCTLVNEFECDQNRFGMSCYHNVAHMLILTRFNIDWSQVGCDALETLNTLACKRNQIEIETHLKMWDTSGYQPSECSVDGIQGDLYIQILQTEIQNAGRYNLINHYTEFNILFTCDEHLMSTNSRAFYKDSWSLHTHYIRTINSDDWVHFKDCWYWIKPRDLNLNEQTVEFTMNHLNYRQVLQNNADILLRKRNFSYYFHPKRSLRCTEFCYMCDFVAYSNQASECNGYIAMPKRDYINREIPNTLGYNLCQCGHAAAMHYLDAEWDERFAQISDYHDALKWPINYWCDIGKIVRVQRSS